MISKNTTIPLVVPPKANPLDMIHPMHIEKYGWGGSCIKAYRISGNMTRSDLARRLHMREFKLSTYENERRELGIKFSKMLGEIFKVDWHVFRKNPTEISK